MKKAVFTLKSAIHKWQPPFGKDITEMDMTVSEGNSFDTMPKEGSIFKLVKCNGNKALIEFSGKFTLKGHLHPRNRQVWIEKDEAVDFTYLWGEDGITKRLKLKEIIDQTQAL